MVHEISQDTRKLTYKKIIYNLLNIAENQ
jgi:hypothetical protein